MLIIFIIIPKENHIEVCKKFGIFPSERRNHKKGNVQRNKRYIPEKNKENYNKKSRRKEREDKPVHKRI